MYKENYPSELLENAVDALGALPGMGKKGALRLALHLLKQPEENVRHLTESISRLCSEVKYCRVCKMISDHDLCSICSDPKRDARTICVVENVRDVMLIEKTGQYHGVYHVLGGIIYPIMGIGPSDLTIEDLVHRVAELTGRGPADCGSNCASTEAVGDLAGAGNSGEVEVVLALNGSVEGETTSFYIYRKIAPFGVKVSTLARGLGFDEDLDYANELTLGRSIVNRQIFKP